MKTSDIEVKDMLSVLSVVGVENRIGEVPGVESVTVNYAAGFATVRYDETRLNVTDIKSAMRQGEYEPAGSGVKSTGGHHKGHAALDKAPETPAAAVPKSPPDAAAAPAGSASAGQPGKAEPVVPPKSSPAPGAAKPVPVAGPTSASDTKAPAASGASGDPADKKPADMAGMDKGHQ